MNDLMPHQRRGMRVEIVQRERDGSRAAREYYQGCPQRRCE